MNLNLEFSNIALYVVILLAIGLFAFFRLMTWLVPLLVLNARRRRYAWRYAALAELFLWIFFLVWSVNFLSHNNELYALGLFLILFLFTLYSAWIGLKDFVSGALFKSTGNFSINESIRVGEYSGRVIRFGRTGLVLETGSGETIFIPYTYLSGKVIVKSHPAETILSYTFRMEVPGTAYLPDTINDIRTYILTLPWSSLVKEPQVKAAGETKNGQLLEITVFSIEKDYFMEMENLVKERFGRVASEQKQNA